jgi:glycosyltransferase involved in cell wall biosynthesis
MKNLTCNKSVLIVGPFPPPFGGQSVLVKNIIESRISKKFNLFLLNTNHQKPKIIFRIFYTFQFTVKLLFILLFSRHLCIVHIHTSAGIAFYEKIIYVVLSRLFNKKVLIHIHGGIFRNFWKNSGKVGQYLILQILNLCHRIVVLSPGWEKYFVKQIQTNTVVMSLPNSTKVENAVVFEKDKFCVSFLYVGHLKPEKGLLDLLEAIQILLSQTSQSFRIRLMGEGDTHDNETLIRNAFLRADIPNVEFLGLLTGEEKWHHFALADVFILPSHSEDMPLTILEAMAFSLPVIATDVGVVNEVIENAVNGFLVEPCNGKMLAEKMKILAENSDLRKMLGAANFLKFTEKYSFQSYELKLEHIYEDVLR